MAHLCVTRFPGLVHLFALQMCVNTPVSCVVRFPGSVHPGPTAGLLHQLCHLLGPGGDPARGLHLPRAARATEQPPVGRRHPGRGTDSHGALPDDGHPAFIVICWERGG